jgi:hypothetical protein
LVTRTLGGAELLACTFDLEKIPALGVCANCRIVPMKNLSSENLIEQRPNSVPNTGVHLQDIWESHLGKNIHQFAQHDTCVNIWWEQHILTATKSLDSFK